MDLLLNESAPQLPQPQPQPQPQLQQNSVLQQLVTRQSQELQEQGSILQQQLKLLHHDNFQSSPLPAPASSSMLLSPFLPSPTTRLEPHSGLVEAANDLLGCLDDFLSPSKFSRGKNTTDFGRMPRSGFDPLWAHIEQRYNSASTPDFLRVQQGLEVEGIGQNTEQ